MEIEEAAALECTDMSSENQLRIKGHGCQNYGHTQSKRVRKLDF